MTFIAIASPNQSLAPSSSWLPLRPVWAKLPAYDLIRPIRFTTNRNLSMKLRSINWTNLVLLLIALVLAALSWSKGGSSLAFAGILSGLQTLVSVIPLLIAAFLIAGLTQVLIPASVIHKWLGTGSGWRGLLIACLAGGLIPGGPYVYYPIAGGLLKAGAGIGVLVSFISAKNLWSVSRLPFEYALLGGRLTLIRYALTFLVPPLLGALAELLFGRFAQRIRDAVP